MTERLVDHLARFDRLVEVGVGQRHDVATGLVARGCAVTATDVRERECPPSVTFVRDDVTDPTLAHYADADAVYALNCPPELQRPARDLAHRVGAPFLFTTLGTDPATVPAEPTTLGDVTLFRARERGPTARTPAAGRHGGESP